MEYDYRNTDAGKRRFSNPKLYRETLRFQKILAENGIDWHNFFSDECTPDFACCADYNKISEPQRLRIPSERIMFKNLFELFLEFLPDAGDTKKYLRIKMTEFERNFL